MQKLTREDCNIGSPEPQTATRFDAILEQTDVLRQQLERARERLYLVVDKLVGTEPPPPCNPEVRSIEQNFCSQEERLLNEMFDILDDINTLITHLGA